jgi:nicotinamidase-related amidase
VVAVSKIAVVLVDVQRDFLDPTSPPDVGSWAKAFCVPAIEQLLNVAREKDWKVVHVGTKHRDKHTLPSHHQRRGVDVYCVEGTPGCEFVVSTRPDEEVVFKTWYSAFQSELIESLGDVSAIIWGGVATDCCIQQSAFDADRQGVHSVIPIQAVSASSAEAFSASLTALAKSAATILDLATVIGLDEPPSTGLDPAEVGPLAREWFGQQQSRLGDVEGLSLEEVLARLRTGATT